MLSDGPPHMAEKNQGYLLEPTYSSSVRIRDVALKTCQKWWTIGRSGERGSRISVLTARHDDDDLTHGWDPYRGFTPPRSRELEPWYLMQFRIIPKTTLLGGSRAPTHVHPAYSKPCKVLMNFEIAFPEKALGYHVLNRKYMILNSLSTKQEKHLMVLKEAVDPLIALDNLNMWIL